MTVSNANFFFFLLGPSVNRHKVFLKQWEESDGEGSQSPTQVNIRNNYPQFTDIPRDATSEDERTTRSSSYHQHRVDVHADAAAAANSSLVDVNVAINA